MKAAATTLSLSMSRLLACAALALVGGCKTRLLELADEDQFDLRSNADLSRAPDLMAIDALLPPLCRNIYVVDANGTFSSFDPPTLTFKDIGPLDCPSKPDDFPEAMAIARDGSAWVLYYGGDLFQVDVDTAACKATPYRAQLGLSGLLGINFSLDQPGGTAETLFIGGGVDNVLARINQADFSATKLGHLPSSPDMTSTGAAELFGFFAADSYSMIARIDKRTAALDKKLILRQFQVTDQTANWAVAFWGGRFWLFLQRIGIDDATIVYRIDPMTGSVTRMLNTSGRSIAGAGVSTCAPLG